MSNLIKISDQGLVSAKELYLGLGLAKDQWARWYKTNIINNEFFHAGHDFVGVRHDVEGNETQDFAITIEFAKHIAMMARTEKSHEYRNYFIKCEDKLKKQKQLSPMEQLKLQYQVLNEHEEKLNTIETKVNVLENNMVIEYGQEVTIKKQVDIQVIKVCFGNESPAYMNKTLRSKIYKAIWKDYKEYFAITSYHNTLKKDLETAIDLIKAWKPTGGLLREIQSANSQMSL